MAPRNKSCICYTLIEHTSDLRRKRTEKTLTGRGFPLAAGSTVGDLLTHHDADRRWLEEKLAGVRGMVGATAVCSFVSCVLCGVLGASCSS